MKTGCLFMTFYIIITLLEAAIEKAGPFKSTIVSARPCENPTLPLDKNPPILYSGVIYNTTTAVNLLRGNLTVLRDTKNKKIKTKGFCWENGKWVTHYVTNMGCNSVMMTVIVAATDLKYDKRTCVFKKGTYIIEDFDTNRMQHMWMSVQEYGRIMWRVEYTSHAGTVFCHNFETLIEPER